MPCHARIEYQSAVAHLAGNAGNGIVYHVIEAEVGRHQFVHFQSGKPFFGGYSAMDRTCAVDLITVFVGKNAADGGLAAAKPPGDSNMHMLTPPADTAVYNNILLYNTIHGLSIPAGCLHRKRRQNMQNGKRKKYIFNTRNKYIAFLAVKWYNLR